MTATPASARTRAGDRRLIATALVAVALAAPLGACTRWRPPPPPPPPPTTAAPGPVPAPGGWQAEMLAAVNTERARAGLGPMSACGSLDRAAQAHAVELAARGQLTHTGADGSTPAARQRAAGYVAAPGGRYLHGAENIAMGYRSVSEVMSGWMRSEGHRNNILAPATNHLGVGRQGNWWVQNFGAGGTC